MTLNSIEFLWVSLYKYLGNLLRHNSFDCIEHTTFWSSYFNFSGLNGQLLSETGIVTSAIDDSKPDGSHPVILGYKN